MDSRVAAAVSSAGSVGSQWQEVVRTPEEAALMDKPPVEQKGAEPGSNIFQRLIWRQIADNCSSDKAKISSNAQGRSSERWVDLSLEGMASSSGDNVEYMGDRSSLLSLQPWVFRKESYFPERNGYGLRGLEDASQTGLLPRCINLDKGPGRGRRSLRSRRTRRYSIRPITSVGNCLVPQLYDQHFEIEEYVFGSPPSLTEPAMRPFVITDGSRIISRSSCDPLGPFENVLHKEVNGVSLGAMGTVIGVPSLPELRTQKRRNRGDRSAQHEGLDTPSSHRSRRLPHSQGSSDRMLLFSLGVSIGVISTILTNRREVEKLNNMLKDTANLVQDLQEELEMKESLTVKELVNEACESHGLHSSSASIKESIYSFHDQVPMAYLPSQESARYDKLHLPKAVENSDSMSKIEAELEAELERLELNMNSVSLDGRMSALGEVDPDLIGSVVHGELRADMLNLGIQDYQADPNGDSSSTSTVHTHNPNYAVSPRELSLRLHKVLQHRLEERIEELERELQESQKKLQFMEAEQVLSQGTFSNSDVGSTNQESPIIMEQDGSLAQPLCLNLSGDALNAYDEAFEEFMRMTDTEETLPSTTDTNKKLYEDGRSLIWGMEGESGNKPSTNVEYIEGEPTWKQILRSSRGSNDSDECDAGDESEIDDEEGKMIQRIVERTRQGSPVVLHAQRMFFSMDE